jgi:hypothetical protein
MTRTALVFPLLANKRPQLDRFLRVLQSDWQEDHENRHRGIPEECWFLQSTPQGDVVIVYLEGEEPAYVFAEIAVSREPFDVWFREEVKELTGVDLSLVPPFGLPECIFERTSKKPVRKSRTAK